MAEETKVQETEVESSEFGKGLAYCLGLFLAHAERDLNLEIYKKTNLGEDEAYMLWFNGASDHLYDLQIPSNFPVTLQERLQNFQDKCLEWGHGYRTKPAKNDFQWAVQEAKNLLFEIDKFYAIAVVKGHWE